MMLLSDYFKILGDVNIVSMLVRVCLVMICAGCLGVERGRSHHQTGMRTYMLVSLGACVVMITDQYIWYAFQTGDPARLGAQVISGIGFLGAGSIVVSKNSRIRGLTTAAGLWASACIGLTIGIGFYELGIVATFAVYLIMTRFKDLEAKLVFDDRWIDVYVEMDSNIQLADLEPQFKEMGLKMGKVHVGINSTTFRKVIISLNNTQNRSHEEILNFLSGLEGFQFVKFNN